MVEKINAPLDSRTVYKITGCPSWLRPISTASTICEINVVLHAESTFTLLIIVANLSQQEG